MKRKIFVQRIPGLFTSLYEKATGMVGETYYPRIAREILVHLGEGLILDLGTGPGYLPIEIARQNPKVKVVGIDLARGLIRTARENAVKAAVTRIASFETGNAARLRFRDCTFDLVVSTGMFHTLKDPVMVLRECCRVLKVAGEAWIWDPAQISAGIDVKRWRASLTPMERLLYRGFLLFSRVNRPHYYTKKEAESLVGQTAFKVIEIEGGGGEIRMRLKKTY